MSDTIYGGRLIHTLVNWLFHLLVVFQYLHISMNHQFSNRLTVKVDRYHAI